MSERHEVTMERRQLLRTGIIGFIATTTSALEVGTVAAADTESDDDKRKARYRADSADVQSFYRVNRYPAK